MKIYKAKDYADMSRKAANIISAQIIMKPECVLGLATGSTPVGLYNQLVEWYKKGDLDFAKKYYNTAISIAPENQTYHFALANLYYSEKHYKKALEELVGDFFEARFLKSVILYETGYLALARKELRDLQTEYPEREMVAEYLNRINSELGLN